MIWVQATQIDDIQLDTAGQLSFSRESRIASLAHQDNGVKALLQRGPSDFRVQSKPFFHWNIRIRNEFTEQRSLNQSFIANQRGVHRHLFGFVVGPAPEFGLSVSRRQEHPAFRKSAGRVG